MYLTLISERLVKMIEDFPQDCMAPVENSEGVDFLGRCFSYVSKCRSRLRFRIDPPKLFPELETDLRRTAASFESLGEVWAWWDNETDTWTVTSDNAEAFKQAANLSADTLALENKIRSESWEIWLDWLRQEGEPMRNGYYSRVTQKTTVHGRIAFEEVKLQDA